VELVVGLAVVLMIASLVVPATAEVMDASRARQAAGFMASRFRLTRRQAVTRSHSVAIVFDLVGGRWTFRLCADGNGNGVRRADVGAGDDPCTEGPYDLEQMFPGVTIGVDPRLVPTGSLAPGIPCGSARATSSAFPAPARARRARCS
jgi:hypothetical protein